MFLKDTFIGTGTMEGFVKETNAIFSAVNNISFIMPSGYYGIEPTVKIESTDGNPRLVFDFGDALIFTTNNVIYNLTGTAVFVSASVSVVNGALIVNVKANIA